jgi:hypothetical protein
MNALGKIYKVKFIPKLVDYAVRIPQEVVLMRCVKQ